MNDRYDNWDDSHQFRFPRQSGLRDHHFRPDRTYRWGERLVLAFVLIGLVAIIVKVWP